MNLKKLKIRKKFRSMNLLLVTKVTFEIYFWPRNHGFLTFNNNEVLRYLIQKAY